MPGALGRIVLHAGLRMALAAVGLATVAPAHAYPTAFEFFGHRFEVRGAQIIMLFGGDIPDNNVFDEHLLIDGNEVHHAPLIALGAIGTIDGRPVIAGTAFDGLWTCAPLPWVVFFPSEGGPSFTGPVDTCSAGAFSASVRGDGVVFAGKPSVLAPGEQWTWHPGDDRFVRAEDIPFVPRTDSGWAAVRDGTIRDPLELMDFADILAAADTLLGEERDGTLSALVGRNFGRTQEGVFTGYGCSAAGCVFIAADGHTDGLYVARSVDDVWTVTPDIADWPKAAETELRAWQTPSP